MLQGMGRRAMQEAEVGVESWGSFGVTRNRGEGGRGGAETPTPPLFPPRPVLFMADGAGKLPLVPEREIV